MQMKVNQRARRWIAGILAGTALATTAWAGGELGTVTISYAYDLDTLDASQTPQTYHRAVLRNIFDPLITLSPDGQEVLPALAESWENIDPLTWRFHLRRDVTFQNGEPFTAEAVKFTLEQAAKPDAMTRPTLGLFKGRVIDDYTIEITSETPEPAILTRFADALFPVPPTYYEQVGAAEFGARPVGTGPYRVVDWTPGNKLILDANDSWYRGAPKASEVVFRIVPESSTRLSTAMTGEADVATQLLPLQTPQIKNADPVHVASAEAGSQPIWMGIQADRPPFDDPRVREAINLAIDRQAIIDRLLLGYGEAMNQPCGRSAPCHDPDVPAIPYDPVRAKALLEAAGATDIETTLGASAGYIGPQAAELAQIMSAYLALVGIKAEPMVEERSVMSDRLYSEGGKDLPDIWIMYYKAGPTAEHALRNLTISDGRWNWNRHFDADIDALWARVGKDFDLASHNASLRAIGKTHARTFAWGYLYDPYSLYAVSNRLKWTPRVDDFILVEEMSLASDG